jgi:predicted glycosyltransferase
MDILTPKQSMFFARLSENLEKRGHQIFRTTRKYREVLQTLKLKGINALVVGEHGGKTLIDKLKASAQRTLKLISIFEEIKPDVSVSFSSPEMARVSYGLKVPHLCINDSPHAEAVAKLTIPLSERLFTPKIIPKKAWTKYGISRKNIVQYNALDPWVWLKDFKPNPGILKELGLDESKPILTFRTEETFAAYLLGIVEKETLLIPLIRRILKMGENFQIVVLPRYDEQIDALREAFKDKIVICDSVVDGSSLLYYSSVFVGAGGTMTAEAALLGIPTFSCYPGENLIIEQYLIRKKLITRETDPERMVKRILEILGGVSYVKERNQRVVQRLVKNFEDPIDTIIREIEEFHENREPIN